MPKSGLSKPYATFPLTPRGDGRWCKRIRGKLHYFRGTADAALREYRRQEDDLQAGRDPAPLTEDATLSEVVELYLDDAEERVELGELSPISYRDYQWVGQKMVDHFGPNIDPTRLKPPEFISFRRALKQDYAVSRTNKTITVCKMIFRWAEDQEHIERLPKFGRDFKTYQDDGVADDPTFKAAEIRAMLEAADPVMKAMILMGINCGFGNTDVTKLTVDKIDLESGWHTFPRPKTRVARRAPLWPETIEALRDVLASRPKTEPELSDRVFLTSRGGEWVTVKNDGESTGKTVNKITPRLRKLMTDCECYKPRRSFYGLRHTHRTIGDGAKDPVASRGIMGHKMKGMDAKYVHDIENERLKAVTDRVRAWLFDEPKGDEEE